MSINDINQMSTVAASNTDVTGISVATGWPPSNVGPAMRALMSLLARMDKGIGTLDTLTVTGAISTGSLSSGGTISAGTVTGNVITGNAGAILPNSAWLQGRDTGSTPRNLIGMDSGNNVLLWNSGGAKIRATNQANNAEIFSIDNSGNGVFSGSLAVASMTGVSSINGIAYPNQALSTSAGVTFGGLTVAGNAYSAGIFPTVNGHSFGFGWDGSAFSFAIDSIPIGSINYTVSDYRLKQDIAPLTGATATLERLRPVMFRYIEHSPLKGDPEPRPGLIAHEVAEAVPSAVHGEKDGLNSAGNIQPQSLQLGPLVAVLIGAVQELTARVAVLEGGSP